MTDRAGAVFLSYAREDSESARRIADALRAFGVEVWFDQHELRGGDVWDQKIRQQIKECRLFVPIISATTESRAEGYFRREWKLAAERTADMGKRAAFLLPVVVDATAESGADVPDEFMRVQWTRLLNGVPTPQFVEQVKRLLEYRMRSAAVVTDAPMHSAPKSTSASKSRAPFAISAAIGAAAAIAALIWFGAGKTPPAAPPSTRAAVASVDQPGAASSPASNAAVVTASIAVLPFANRSEDKANAFFTDAVHEDVLTNLALIRTLRVVSRTSVMQYRDTTKPVGQIARELGVAHVLEGSVQRVGNKVRVTAKLIKASSDEPVWARNFDKDLTDVFAIQSEIAQSIAEALHAALSPEAARLLARKPTDNAAAYDLFAKARDLRNRDGTSWRTSLEQQESFLLSAVALDAKFAAAWANLAWIHAAYHFWNFDTTEARRTKAREAIAHALQLGPGLPDVMLSEAWVHYFAERNFDKALAQFEQVERILPSSAEPRFAMAAIYRRQGRWREAMESYWTVVRKDPRWLDPPVSGSMVFVACRRYKEAGELLSQAIAHHPGDTFAKAQLAKLRFKEHGSTTELEEWGRQIPEAEQGADWVASLRIEFALLRGDLAEALRADEIPAGRQDAFRSLMVAAALVAKGRRQEASDRIVPLVETLRGRIKVEPENAVGWSNLGMVLALSGEKEDARLAAQRSVELVPVSLDSWTGMFLRARRALVLAWIGDKPGAIAEYTSLLAIPCYEANVQILRHLPLYHPLRGDPRFEALLNDPKNNAPLF